MKSLLPLGVVARARRSLGLILGGHDVRDGATGLEALLRGLENLDAGATLAPDSAQLARVEWFERLAAWLFGDPAPHSFSSRLEELTELLARDAVKGEAFRTQLRRLLTNSSGLRLFAETGVISEFGVFGELFERIIRRLLPEPPQPSDLSDVLRRIVSSASGASRGAELSPSAFRSLVALLSSDADTSGWRHVQRDMVDAVTVLAARVASIGVSSDVIARLPEQSPRELPFLALVRHVEELVGVLLRAGAPSSEASAAAAAAARRVLATTGRCRVSVGQVVARLETQGVSLHLVYRLEQLSALLDRLDSLVRLLDSRGAHTPRALALLLRTLVQGIERDRSVRSVVQGAARQLSRKVVERTGVAGKHYMTHSRAAWWKMLQGAAGGGALTVVTTALKFLTGWAQFAPFFHGLALSINYAGSFIVMQLAGFKLATKQPAMFAAALADSLLDARSRLNSARFVSEVAHVTRSQAAAVLGNLGAAVPVALAFDLICRLTSGHSFLDAEDAAYAVQSLDPIGSGTVFFAAVTGGILMVSSLAGGWLENFAVYRRIPEAIARHRVLHRLIGPRRVSAWARSFMHGVAGIGTSVTLGVLLGMLPQIGAFFGVPLEVRHVTLSTAQLTLGLSALGTESLFTSGAGLAMLGILVIGALNFGVSFALAMMLAIRAREVSVPEALRLLRLTSLEFVRRPLAFLFPLGSDAPTVEPRDRDETLAEHMARASPEHDPQDESVADANGR